MKKINSNLVKLLHILNDGHFHAGEEIGKQLGITRSAIWKGIEKLKGYGLIICSVKGKGYSMVEPVVLLDNNKIRRLLDQDLKELVEISIFESIASTNDYLKKIPNKNRIKICLAEQQTQGKGRFGRYWHSPFAQNIYFSCRYQFRKDISELAGLSLVVGLAVIKTLVAHGVKNKIAVKWPNDILWENKKLAGTLIEIDAETHGVCAAIIGIGINVNMKDADDKAMAQPSASIQQVLDKPIDRNNIVATLINNLIHYVQQFELHGLVHFINEWKTHDHLHDRTVTIINGAEEITGKAAGINEQGHLLLKLRDGKLHAFSSGDATIKKNI
jgi:BirA family transcriptional regulator, biotin operon repressor / biotin---[acetyl-CoA-carboxylase] ligase